MNEKNNKLLQIQAFKVWVFWKGQKIWKNLRRTFDKSVVFCARNSRCLKLDKIYGYIWHFQEAESFQFTSDN